MKKEIKQFEVLGHTVAGNLVGGFSSALSAVASEQLTADTNNCQGQNCAAFCGVLQNNGACNSIPGCGKSL